VRPSLGAGRRVDQRMRWFAASGRGRPVRLRSGGGLSCGRASCRACVSLGWCAVRERVGDVRVSDSCCLL
jgi:hypothetical protein